MAGAGTTSIGHLCSAYVGEIHASPSEVLKLRGFHLQPSVGPPARKPLHRLLFVGDGRSRRGTKFLETVLNKDVFVTRGSGRGGTNDPSSASSSHQHFPDGPQPRDESREDSIEVSPVIWDLQQLKAAAARIGDPLREILSSASRKWQNCFDNYRKARFEQDAESVEEVEQHIAQEEKWDWERWREHFLQVEEQEKLVASLKFQLECAVSEEDFKEAARLKGALEEAIAIDPVSQVLAELKMAVQDECYETAMRLRDEAAAGLLGWWVGLAKGESDPYGRIINISLSYGRFVARAYTARQLASASVGTPLFEVFIQKDLKGYHQQAVYLQRGGSGESLWAGPTSIDVNIDVNIVDMNSLAEDGKENSKDLTEAFDEKGKNGEAQGLDDGLNGIINFIKDRIPEVKLKVFRVIAQNGEDIPKIVEQILEEVETRESEDAKKGNEVMNEEILQEVKDKSRDVGDVGESMQGVQKEIPIRLIVGGTLQNAAEEKLSKALIRRQARIENETRDRFLLHIDELEPVPTKEILASSKSTTATGSLASTELPSEIPKVVSNLDKVPVKVSKDMGELLKIAISQVQRRRGLSRCTVFERIKLTNLSTDPMTGLYIGAFGPYTSELVQLHRKYGHWHEETDMSEVKGRLKFFEYVEAVKLTGDLNVPAGQVTFRAKISKDCRLSHRGIYPEELGVVARYKGQGRLAEPGFKNPHWVDGELLLLDGKGFGHVNGAELGFVYSVPERHFLVLFNRLQLQVDQCE